MSRLSRKHRSFVAAAGSLVLAATGLMGTPTTSASPAAPKTPAPPGQVVVSGLDNPRLISFAPNGAIYCRRGREGRKRSLHLGA